MSTVNLNPISSVTGIRLPPTGTHSNVLSSLAYGIYTSDSFISGAVDAVALAYNYFAGNVLDLEVEEQNAYCNYEAAVLKYSYYINSHQAQNILFEVLGFQTSSFNQDGQITTGTDLSTKYPRFNIDLAKRVAMTYGAEVLAGGNVTTYSASFPMIDDVQDYDLDEILNQSTEFSGIVANKQILIKNVYYNTRRSAWRFFGGLGGFGSVAGMSSYSSYANSSRFFLKPTWETKLEQMAYEDALWTRTAHQSFKLINNKLRIMPIPKTGSSPDRYWFEFQVADVPWSGSAPSGSTEGITNLNNLPVANIPYDSINSVGKQWIRDYYLALMAETLGWVRDKFDSIPISQGNIRLNGKELLTWGQARRKELEEELKKKLDELVWANLSLKKKELTDNALELLKPAPLGIYFK